MLVLGSVTLFKDVSKIMEYFRKHFLRDKNNLGCTLSPDANGKIIVRFIWGDDPQPRMPVPSQNRQLLGS